MTKNDLQELDLLLERLCEEGLEEDQHAISRLIKLVDESEACRRHYLDTLELHAMLWTMGEGGVSLAEVLDEPDHATSDHLHQVESFEGPSPTLTFLSNPLHGSAGYLSSWPVAYLIATVIFGIGALIGTFTYVSHPVQVAKELPPAITSQSIPKPQVEFVGRITGMVDCRWADESTASTNGAYVPLGRKYSLSAGLMEITYDTGAKVILQGPVTYEVESLVGGYLSLGKLTAKVEKKVANGQWLAAGKSEISNPSPSTTRHPLFTIKTPTVIVTDLGTEFGVEVDQQGGTKSHVFQGVVEVQLTANSGQLGKIIRLDENESLCVEKQQDDAGLKIVRDTVDSAIFVRSEQLPKLAREHVLKPLRRWQAYSEQLRQDPALVAYYTFEPDGQHDTSILPNLSAAGSVLDGHVEVAEWAMGRFPGKHALQFHGPGSYVKLARPEQDPFNFTGPFTVAVWFKVDLRIGMHQTLITKGDNTWRIQQDRGEAALTFDHNNPATSHIVSGSTNVFDEQWHLAAIVYEPVDGIAKKRLYVDGRLDAKGELECPLRHNEAPVMFGGNPMYPERGLYGSIDEAVMLSRAMSADEILTMFQSGRPTNERR